MPITSAAVVVAHRTGSRSTVLPGSSTGQSPRFQAADVNTANEITSLFLLLTALDAYHLSGAEEPRERALLYLKQFNTPSFTSTLDSYNVAWSSGDVELIDRTLSWMKDNELRIFLMFIREFVHSKLATQGERRELLKDGVLVQWEEPKLAR